MLNAARSMLAVEVLETTNTILYDQHNDSNIRKQAALYASAEMKRLPKCAHNTLHLLQPNLFEALAVFSERVVQLKTFGKQHVYDQSNN